MTKKGKNCPWFTTSARRKERETNSPVHHSCNLPSYRLRTTTAVFPPVLSLAREIENGSFSESWQPSPKNTVGRATAFAHPELG
jgi:hypothetical protein